MRWRRIVGLWRVVALGVAMSACVSAPPPPPVEHARPRAAPAPPMAVDSYEDVVRAEEAGGLAALQIRELEPGSTALHLVLDAGRCFRIVAAAERSVALALTDEHGHALAERAGRVVRFASVCPRWSGSFELSAVVDGARGRLWLYEDEAVAPDGSSEPASSITR